MLRERVFYLWLIAVTRLTWNILRSGIDSASKGCTLATDRLLRRIVWLEGRIGYYGILGIGGSGGHVSVDPIFETPIFETKGVIQ
jgi:hypothetical protein